MGPRNRGIAVRPGPGVGGDRPSACCRSRAPVAGRKRPGQRSRHRSTGPRRRRIVARTVARGSAERERDERSRGVRIRASRLCGEPAGRSPRARLGAAGHDGRIHGYRGARAVHLGAARPCAAGVASVRWVHRAHPNRTSDVHACRGQPHERSGVGFDRRGRRHRAALGARRARGSPGDAAASHRRGRSRRRSRARRANQGSSRFASWSTGCRHVCGRSTPAAAQTIDISRRWRCMQTSM